MLDEIGIDARKHKPRTLRGAGGLGRLNFDLIITLSPEAHHTALELTRTIAVEVEYWPTPDPTLVQGSREQMLDAYRGVRDLLTRRIKERWRARQASRRVAERAAMTPLITGRRLHGRTVLA